MSKKLPKWYEKEVVRIKGLSNKDLLEATIHLAGGDDYDGCFTDRGVQEFGLLKEELSKRLVGAGWLENPLE
jgi:hypothetical protein